MQAAGIESFKLIKNDFEFSLSGDKKCCIHFSPKKSSISEIVKNMDKKLWQVLDKEITETDTFQAAIQDIENQLVKRRDEIYGTSANEGNTSSADNDQDNFAKQNYIHRVNEQRKKFKNSNVTYEQWQQVVAEKYGTLRKVVLQHHPEAWIFLEFSLAVKSILHIEGFTLPFMGVILAAPSSTKTLVIQLFKRYPGSFYTDSFTASSLVSHNSALSEEQLQKVDMLPKIKDKLVLTPELAPLFTAKEDDLQKMLGTLTRVLDGHGFGSDSGAQGHRGYGDTMFAWLGSAVEIPPHVWKLLGTLGHKIYFLRPPKHKKSISELKKIAKHNHFSANNKEIGSALLDCLITFDSAPEKEGKIKIDLDGHLKVRWSEEIEDEQDKAIECIAQVANLLAPLRGNVSVSTNTYFNPRAKDDQGQGGEILDYDVQIPTIEDASRAVTLLRNLAIGHAISQGRDSIDMKDLPLIIKTALSTANIRRVLVLDLLLKNKGEITTSQINQEIKIAYPTARLTLREFETLGIVYMSAVTGYRNGELKATLKSEFDWFKSEEFKKLREDFIPTADTSNRNDSGSKSNDDVSRTTDEHSASKEEIGYNAVEACDPANGHTLKVNSPPRADTKNDVLASSQLEQVAKESEIINRSDIPSTTRITQESINNSTKIDTDINKEFCKYNTQNITDEYKNDNTENPLKWRSAQENTNKNSASARGVNYFQHVTQSHGHTLLETDDSDIKQEEEELAHQQIIAIIEAADGHEVVVNNAIKSAHSKSEQVSNYIGDKLTQRENKRVKRLCLKIIRNENVLVVKYRPQLVVKWTPVSKTVTNSNSIASDVVIQ